MAGRTADEADTSATEFERPRVRDRIFAKACELFYRQGIRAVGVDAIAAEAGTNKMSFYRSFASKDELVAEYLKSRDLAFFAWWDEVVAPFEGDPRRQVEALFDAHAGKSCAASSRGCGLTNAAVEITEPEHPALPVIHAHKAEIRRRLRRYAKAMDARDADQLGDGLMLLMEGAHLTRLAFARGGPAVCAGAAARTLMDAHCG